MQRDTCSRVSNMPTHTITPYLTVNRADEAISFYEAAFGFEEVGPRLEDNQGNIIHTEMKLGDSSIMLSEEMPGFGNKGPKSLRGTSVRISLQVDDAHGLASRAQTAGAKLEAPIEDQFYGQRTGRLVDPFGHVWIISQEVEQLSGDEIQQRTREYFRSQT